MERMESEKIPMWKVVELALLKGLNGRGVIALLGLRNTLPEVLRLGWVAMDLDHDMPKFDQIEFPLDDPQLVPNWLLDVVSRQGHPPFVCQMFGYMVHSTMTSKMLDRHQVALYAGFPVEVMIAIDRGYVPIDVLPTLLPQLAAGLDVDLALLRSQLDEAIELANSPRVEDSEMP